MTAVGWLGHNTTCQFSVAYTVSQKLLEIVLKSGILCSHPNSSKWAKPDYIWLTHKRSARWGEELERWGKRLKQINKISFCCLQPCLVQFPICVKWMGWSFLNHLRFPNFFFFNFRNIDVAFTGGAYNSLEELRRLKRAHQCLQLQILPWWCRDTLINSAEAPAQPQPSLSILTQASSGMDLGLSSSGSSQSIPGVSRIPWRRGWALLPAPGHGSPLGFKHKAFMFMTKYSHFFSAAKNTQL